MIDAPEQFCQRWTNAWIERDIATVEALMTPHYHFVDADGVVWSRERVAELVQSADYRLSWSGRSEISVELANASCAIIVCRWRGEGVYRRRRFADDQRCTSVLVRHGAQWLVAHEHCSPIGAG